MRDLRRPWRRETWRLRSASRTFCWAPWRRPRPIAFLPATDVTILSDRRARGPYGLNGGKAGKPGRNSLLRGKKNIAIPAKANFMSQPGDVLRIETPGGGGWGRK